MSECETGVVLDIEDYTGATAYSKVPEGYKGPCTLEAHGKTTCFLEFPSVEQAVEAARMAIAPLGGYREAIVHAGSREGSKAYESAHTWLYG